MASPRKQKDFLPFNFAAVMPTDALASVMTESQPPHRSEPEIPDAIFSDHEIISSHPSSTIKSEILNLLSKSAKEGEWGNLRDILAQSSQPSQSDDWLDSFTRHFDQKLDHLSKRQASSPKQKASRSTPKRPRTTRTVIVTSDAEEEEHRVMRTRGIRGRVVRERDDAVVTEEEEFEIEEEEVGDDDDNDDEDEEEEVGMRDGSDDDGAHEQEMRIHQIAKDMDIEGFNAFVEYLSKFVRKAHELRSHTVDIEDANLKITSNPAYMTELLDHMSTSTNVCAIQHVQVDLLKAVISTFETRIIYTLRQLVVASESPELSTISEVECLLGLYSAQAVLSIITAPNSPRTLLVEELLDSLIELVKTVCTTMVYPVYDPLYSSTKPSKSSRRKKATLRKRRAHIGVERDNFDAIISKPSKAVRRPPTRKDEAVNNECCAVFDILSALFLKEQYLPDSVVRQCFGVCIQSLSVTGIVRLQRHAIKTVSAIFSSYSAHRVSILDDVREKACLVPANRRHLRCFQLEGERTEIRMTSALLAQLLCYASTDAEEKVEKSREEKSDETVKFAWSLLRRKRHDRAAKLAAHLFEPLLTRAYSDREPEYRTAFHTLFEDVLELYGRPDWPSAELMLQTISVSVITKLRARDDKTAYFRSVSIDVLGTLAAKMCVLYGNELLQKIPRAQSLQEQTHLVEKQRETLLLFLDPKESLQFAAAHSFYEALFTTDDQNLAFSIRKRAKEITAAAQEVDLEDGEEILDGEDASMTSDDEIHSKVQKCGQLRAQCVTNRRGKGEKIDTSEAFSAARLVGINRSFAGGFQTILDAILEGMHDAAPTVRAKSIKALAVVDEACQGILCFLPAILQTIEASCRDMSTLARDAALDLLSKSIVQNTPYDEGRCRTAQGSRTSHTENPEFFAKVFAIVEKRLSDTATSVRKRAISIMRAVMVDALQRCSASSSKFHARFGEGNEATRHYEQRIIQICESLVPRLDDPETSVREASERTLRLGLFGFDISQQPQPDLAEQPELVSVLSERLITVFMKLHPSMHSSFMSRVVHKTLLIKHQPMLCAIINITVELLHEYEAKHAEVNISNDTSSQQLRRTIPKRRVACASVIAAFAGMDPGLLAPYCRALAPSIKGVLDGKVSESDLICVQRILKVLELGLGQSSDLDQTFLDEVMHDVEVIVCQSPIASLEEASVRCLCVVAKKAGTAEAADLLKRTASNFMAFLKEKTEKLRQSCSHRQSQQQKPAVLERNARCALVRLGLLTRHGAFDSEFVQEVYETLETTCIAVCVSTARDTLARASVRALSYLLIRHRALLTKGTQLLLLAMKTCKGVERKTSDLSDGLTYGISKHRAGIEAMTVAESVELSVLQGFHELLRDEEDRNSVEKKDSGEAHPSQSTAMKSADATECIIDDESVQNEKAGISSNPTAPVLGAEEDAEAGFLALSAQAMIPELEESVRSPKMVIRRTVANILGLLVRQGLVLPATVVTSLFSLLLDKDPRCREYSYRVISFLADRHSGMLASASLPAFRLCFESSFLVRFGFQPLSYDEKNTGDQRNGQTDVRYDATCQGSSVVSVEQLLDMSIDEKSGQSLLSPAIMAMRRDQRRGVLESLMREFDPRVSVQQTENSAETNIHENGMDIIKLNGKVDNENCPGVSGLGGQQDKNDEDDDVGYVPMAEVDIIISEKLCPLASLYFLAITLATIDYTHGAGVGGSLSQGGGTSAAETKLKYAREDVNYLVGIATRIISNSGQATLRVAKQLMRKKNASLAKKRKVALCASRISLLLALKSHLKITRWKSVVDVDEDSKDVDLTAINFRMPRFTPDGTGLVVASRYENLIKPEVVTDMNSVFEVFERLMREDAIDENDMAVPSRRVSKAGPSSRRRSGGRSGGGKRGRPKVSAETVAKSKRREKLNRRASAGKIRKAIVFAEGSSDDDDSEFDPRAAR